jgi:hypothetical protein
MPGALDRHGQLSLMAEAIARDPTRHDPAALRQKISQEPDIFEIDRRLIETESARLAPLKESTSATTRCSLHTCLRLIAAC